MKVERSPAYSFIRQRVQREFRVLDQEQITPWAFLRTDKGVRVKKFDGGEILLSGLELTGSARDIFWGENIRLYLEDIVSRSFEETRKFCDEHSIDRKEPLEETDLELQRGCSRIYSRMAEIDRNLRGKGFPRCVPRYQPDREIEDMRKFIWDRHEAEVGLTASVALAHNPTSDQSAMDYDYDYDVALSFAGEQRDYVEEVARLLRAESVSVFYDGFEEANLWGKNLYEHLADVYGKKARYSVIFCSREYAEKLWTNHERQSAQERAFRENQEYILPARFDDTEIPGILKTTGYVDLRNKAPEELCNLIIAKLRKPDSSSQVADHPTQPSLSAAARELLGMIEREEDPAKRGIVEIMQGVVPNETAFFPRLQYSGSPVAMKSRLFREAVAQLIEKDYLYPPEYNEMTDTMTYEFRE